MAKSAPKRVEKVMRLKNPKQKGSRAELEAKAELERRGYFVLKSGGSLSNLDLLCLPSKWSDLEPPVCLGIQVKSNRLPSKGELRALAALVLPPYFRKEIWLKSDRRGWLTYDVVELSVEAEELLRAEDGGVGSSGE